MSIKKIDILPPPKKKLPVGEFLLLFLVGRFFTLAGTYISNVLIAITERFLKSQISDSTSALISAAPAWLIFIGAVIIAPIIEELVYRKIIIDRIYAHGEWIAIFFSSIIFALAHGNLYQVSYAFLNGCILGLIYTRTGHLRYSIAFHMLTNFLGSIAILPVINAQTKLETMLSAGKITTECIKFSMLISGYSIAKIFLALLGVLVLCLCYKQFIPKKQAIDPIPRGFVFHTVVVNPGFIGFLVVSAVEFVISFY
jgi:membrane protease YdiL (CAAX protease family)